MGHTAVETLWQWLDQTVPWLPDWAFSAGVTAAAAGVALLVHWWSLRLVRHLPVPDRGRNFLQVFVTATTGPSRLALVVFALVAVLPFTSFPAGVSRGVGQTLLLGFIVLVGWSAIRAVGIAATLYLQRFRLDADDNLLARKHVTQVRILKRAGDVMIVLVTTAVALMSFESVRGYGVSLFASAGAASLVAGLAARPLLTNLIAGVQIAVTQPIRLEDAVVVEGEWGWVEEITGTYVVVRLWDWRRMILPLSYFLERPFQNWTRETASLIGSVFLHVDYAVPVEAMRQELARIARGSPLWDGRVVNLQVSDATERTIQLRALVSARNAPQTWDLRCEVREKLIAFLQREHPQALPTARVELHADAAEAGRPGAGVLGQHERRAAGPRWHDVPHKRRSEPQLADAAQRPACSGHLAGAVDLVCLAMNSTGSQPRWRRAYSAIPDRSLSPMPASTASAVRAHRIQQRTTDSKLEPDGQPFTEPLTLENLAVEAGVSKFHFTRLFRESAGAPRTRSSFSSGWRRRDRCWARCWIRHLRMVPCRIDDGRQRSSGGIVRGAMLERPCQTCCKPLRP